MFVFSCGKDLLKEDAEVWDAGFGRVVEELDTEAEKSVAAIGAGGGVTGVEFDGSNDFDAEEGVEGLLKVEVEAMRENIRSIFDMAMGVVEAVDFGGEEDGFEDWVIWVYSTCVGTEEGAYEPLIVSQLECAMGEPGIGCFCICFEAE